MGALCGKVAGDESGVPPASRYHADEANPNNPRRGAGAAGAAGAAAGAAAGGGGPSPAYVSAVSSWDVDVPPITRAELTRQRQEFWETRVQGQPEMWQALRAASECADTGTATVIMESAGLTPYDADSPHHCFCYDSRGFRYEVPFLILLDPRSVIESDAPSAANAANAASTASAGTATAPTSSAQSASASSSSSSSSSSSIELTATTSAAPPASASAGAAAPGAATSAATSSSATTSTAAAAPSSAPISSTFGADPNADLHFVVRLSNALGDVKLACMRTDTIGQVRTHLANKFTLPTSAFLFLLHGQRLLDQYSLRDCGLGNEVVLQCFVRPPAGAAA